MSLWNKILVGLILVVSALCLFLGARTLKTHQYWRSIAVRLEAALKEEAKKHDDLLKGVASDPAKPGLRQLDIDLYEVLAGRGRTWRNCTPMQVSRRPDPPSNQEMVEVSVNTEQPHQIGVKTVLFAFEGTNVQDGGSYLGQFTVVAAPPTSLQLQPTKKLADWQIKRLEARRGPWTLYELMPADRHDVLTELKEDEIRAMFPDSIEAEYLADGRPTDPKNPQSPPAVRKLRGYEVLLDSLHDQMSVLTARTEHTTYDLQALRAAQADTNGEIQARQNEITSFKTDLAAAERERDAVNAHREAVEGTLKAVQERIAQFFTTNRALAGELARIQLEATRRIDEQTQRMAQSRPLR